MGLLNPTTAYQETDAKTPKQLPRHSRNSVNRRNRDVFSCYVKGKEQLTLGSTFLSMRLHSNVRVQVVERAVSLFATVPTTLVHPLNLFIASSRSLVLLCARDGHERINLNSNMY